MIRALRNRIVRQPWDTTVPAAALQEAARQLDTEMDCTLTLFSPHQASDPIHANRSLLWFSKPSMSSYAMDCSSIEHAFASSARKIYL